MKTELISLTPNAPGSEPDGNMPASADLLETNFITRCDTARLGSFGPFRFRINVKPGRKPRFACRVLRKDGAAGYFGALNHI
jgi:hypothetical protein